MSESEIEEQCDEDLVLAYRYCYYVHGISFVPDDVYDRLEKRAREITEDFESILHLPGSDIPSHYPDRIRALAAYLICLHREKHC